MTDAALDAVEKIDVAYVARLAQLALTDDELRAFQGQLEKIVEYVKDVRQIDVAGIEPMAHAVQIHNVFRKDEPRRGLERDAVLANAPAQDGDQFLVPKIV